MYLNYVNGEIEVFQAAYNERVPILLKGPTGTGKTRFVEYMSWKINNNENKVKDIPLVGNFGNWILVYDTFNPWCCQ